MPQGLEDNSAAPRLLYADEHILVVDKPSGLLSYPDGYIPETPHLTQVLEAQYGKLWRLHRLDKGTSGAVLLARDAETHRLLSEAFQKHSVRKRYHCLAWPSPGWDELSLDSPLLVNADRRHRTHAHPRGKPALTQARVMQREGQLALLELEIFTGITHQIRAHLWQAGLAICGDPLYLPPQAKATETPCKPERMLLHAWHLGFEHPITREYLDVYAPDRQVFAPFIRLNATIPDAPGAAIGAPTGQ
jgi:RluA family pseudouridine synthase